MNDLAGIIGLTLKLAGVTTAILIVLATPLAWWLAKSTTWRSQMVGAVVSLPIVLPPTVLGFYLLIALGPHSVLMAPLQAMGIRTLAFTFTGLVIGSVVYSLPFAVQPLRNAFQGVDQDQLDSASTLGASALSTFARVALPLSIPGYVVAAILTFAHTIGEFGVVLMIGGSVPGKTEVISTRIYQLVESLQYGEAHKLAAGVVVFSFAALLALLLVDRRAGGAPR